MTLVVRENDRGRKASPPLLQVRPACRMVAMATAFVLFGPIAKAAADDHGGWRLAGEAPDLRVYYRDVAGTGVPEAQVRGRMKAPPARAYAVASAYDDFEEFVPYVVESRTLAQRGDTRWVYQRVRFPGPVSARAYVLEVVDHTDGAAAGRYRITWETTDEGPAAQVERTAVEPAFFTGSWKLAPVSSSSGATEATYTVHMDPGGWIPDWLVALGTKRYLPNVFRAVHERAEGRLSR